MDTELFKYFGAVSIALIWIGLFFVVYKWPGNSSMSFSLHAAQTKAAQVYYFFLFLITLPLFYLFIIFWYVPTLHLGTVFIILATIGTIGQFIAVIVPAIPGRKETIHNIAAYTMGATFVPMSLMVAYTDVSIFVKAVAVAGAAFMIISCISYLTVQRLRPYYLYFQASYIASFHIVIAASAYVY